MRLAGSLTIAIVTAWCGLAWGQAADPGAGQLQAAPVIAAANHFAPADLVTPGTEGTWVSDDQASSAISAQRTAGPGRPLPMGGRPLPMGARPLPMGAPHGVQPTSMISPGSAPPQMMPPGYAPQQSMGGPFQGEVEYSDGQDGDAPEGDGQCADGSCCDDPCGDGFCGDCMDGSCDEDCSWAESCCRWLHGGPPVTTMWDEVHAQRRWYVSADSLAWWTRGNPTPALVTTSFLGTPQAQAGVLGAPNTSILFGNRQLDTVLHSGGRINFGHWLGEGEFCALEGHFLALSTGSTDFSANSTFANGQLVSGQILARPFINTQTGNSPDSALVAFPGALFNGRPVDLSGGVTVHTTSNVQSAGGGLRKLLWVDFTSNYRIDIVGGYRYFRADDSVVISDQVALNGFPFQTGTSLTSTDIFSAKNQFNGGEIGLSGQFLVHNRLSLSGLAKIAMGNNHETMYITGYNSVITPQGKVSTPGGLLTQPSNIGTHVRNQFALLPEAQLNARLELTRNMRALFGYTFIYLDKAQRSGSGIDTSLNPTQINGGTLSGPARPAFAFQSSDYWAQGFNVGLEFRW